MPHKDLAPLPIRNLHHELTGIYVVNTTKDIVRGVQYGTVEVSHGDAEHQFRTSFKPAASANPSEAGGLWQGELTVRVSDIAVGKFEYVEGEFRGVHRIFVTSSGTLLILVFDEEESLVANVFWIKVKQADLSSSPS